MLSVVMLNVTFKSIRLNVVASILASMIKLEPSFQLDVGISESIRYFDNYKTAKPKVENLAQTTFWLYPITFCPLHSTLIILKKKIKMNKNLFDGSRESSLMTESRMYCTPALY
jgi:hypothetical protein